MDVGHTAEQVLKHSKVIPKDAFAFKMECKQFLFSVTKKIPEKSFLRFPLVRSLSSPLADVRRAIPVHSRAKKRFWTPSSLQRNSLITSETLYSLSTPSSCKSKGTSCDSLRRAQTE